MLKRLFDIVFALVLMVMLSPLLLGVVLWMVLRGDKPVFYVSERMKTVDEPFDLVKFRTMSPHRPGETNTGVSGGDKSNRITPLGLILRHYRLDELPQLWNILKGDMSFVGPRPPLRRYTDSHRELYRKVLRSKPGVTGLASLVMHRYEERILAKTSNALETERIYMRRSIPRKARIDLIYQDHPGICHDLHILTATVIRVFLGCKGGKARRVSSRSSSGVRHS